MTSKELANMDYCLYLIICKINNKKYVGITKQSLENRWKMHKYTGFALHSAIVKYGANNFKFKIIKQDLTESEAKSLEIEYIKLHNSKSPNGYNLTSGGDGVRELSPRS